MSIGPEALCLPLWLKRPREEITSGSGTLRLHGCHFSRPCAGPGQVRVLGFLRRELDGIGTVVSPPKTAVLLPKGQSPTTDKISLLGSVDVPTAEERRATVVVIAPIGTLEQVQEREKGDTKGGKHKPPFAHSRAGMRDEQATALIAVESVVQRTSYL